MAILERVTLRATVRSVTKFSGQMAYSLNNCCANLNAFWSFHLRFSNTCIPFESIMNELFVFLALTWMLVHWVFLGFEHPIASTHHRRLASAWARRLFILPPYGKFQWLRACAIRYGSRSWDSQQMTWFFSRLHPLIVPQRSHFVFSRCTIVESLCFPTWSRESRDRCGSCRRIIMFLYKLFSIQFRWRSFWVC